VGDSSHQEQETGAGAKKGHQRSYVSNNKRKKSQKAAQKKKKGASQSKSPEGPSAKSPFQRELQQLEGNA